MAILMDRAKSKPNGHPPRPSEHAAVKAADEKRRRCFEELAKLEEAVAAGEQQKTDDELARELLAGVKSVSQTAESQQQAAEARRQMELWQRAAALALDEWHVSRREATAAYLEAMRPIYATIIQRQAAALAELIDAVRAEAAFRDELIQQGVSFVGAIPPCALGRVDFREVSPRGVPAELAELVAEAIAAGYLESSWREKFPR